MKFSEIDIRDKTKNLKDNEFYVSVGYDFQNGKEIKSFCFILDLNRKTTMLGELINFNFILNKLIENSIVPFFSKKEIAVVVEIITLSSQLEIALEKNHYPIVSFCKKNEKLHCWLYPKPQVVSYNGYIKK